MQTNGPKSKRTLVGSNRTVSRSLRHLSEDSAAYNPYTATAKDDELDILCGRFSGFPARGAWVELVQTSSCPRLLRVFAPQYDLIHHAECVDAEEKDFSAWLSRHGRLGRRIHTNSCISDITSSTQLNLYRRQECFNAGRAYRTSCINSPFQRIAGLWMG